MAKQTIDKMLDTVAEQNVYNNHNGQIPRSTFIKKWHEETTNDLYDILVGATEMIESTTNNPELQDLIFEIAACCKQNKDKPFVNVANPSNAEINRCKKSHAWDFDKKSQGIKSKYWQMKRLIAEHYNREYSIDIYNDDGDINK